MKKVKLIKEPNYTERLILFFKLGEPKPVIGEIYTVAEYVNFTDISDYPHLIERGLTEYKGYVLEEFDMREVGIILAIHESCFETISNEFVPNRYVTELGFEGLVEETIVHYNYKIDLNEK